MSKKTKKRIIVVLSILLFLIGGGVIGTNLYIDSILNKMNQKDTISDSQAGVNKTTKKASEEKDIINIALLGIDNDGSLNRSDAMKIISLNFKENSVIINSIQRDNLVMIPEKRFDKLNHAYQYGGAELTLKTFNYNLDMDITRYVSFNFNSVSQIVDMLGGVDITLTAAEATCIQKPGAGTYTLSGKEALNYSRLRAVDNDYNRMQRQNNVISAIMAKVSGKSATEMLSIISNVLPLIETNLTNNEIKTYVTKMVGFNIANLKQYQLPSGGYNDILQSITLYGYGPHYLLKDFSGMVEELHHNIYGNTDYKASEEILKLEKTMIDSFYTGQ